MLLCIIAQELFLGHNCLTSIPSSLGTVSTLCVLDISHNTELRELPGLIGGLANMHTLVASHMRLKQLPRYIMREQHAVIPLMCTHLVPACPIACWATRILSFAHGGVGIEFVTLLLL